MVNAQTFSLNFIYINMNNKFKIGDHVKLDYKLDSVINDISRDHLLLITKIDYEEETCEMILVRGTITVKSKKLKIKHKFGTTDLKLLKKVDVYERRKLKI